MGRVQQIGERVNEANSVARLIFLFFIEKNFSNIKEKVEAIKLVKKVLEGGTQFEFQSEIIKTISGSVLQFIDLISQQYKISQQEIISSLPFTPEEIEILVEDD